MTGNAVNRQPRAMLETRAREFADAFRTAACDWLAGGQARIAALRQDPADQETAAELFRGLHDLKGQGETFGYPLVSRIAELAGEGLRHPPFTDEAIRRAGRGIAILQRVLEDEMTGSDPPGAEALLAALHAGPDPT